MASDRELGRQLLAGVAEQVRIVLLHREEALTGDEPLSDLDCAVAPERRGDAIRAVRMVGNGLGLTLVAVWPYDTAGLSLFLMSGDLTRSVQFDLLADEDGLGRYGIRTRPLVESARSGSGPWLRPAAVDEALYLASKRTVKEQPERVVSEHRRLRDLPAVAPRAAELLAPHAQARLVDVAGLPSPDPARRLASLANRARTETERRVRRMLTPIGAWVHLVTPGGAPTDAGAVLGVDAARLAPPLVWRGAPPQRPADEARLLARSLSHEVVLTCGAGRCRRAAVELAAEPGGEDRVRAQVLTALSDRARSRLRALAR